MAAMAIQDLVDEIKELRAEIARLEERWDVARKESLKFASIPREEYSRLTAVEHHYRILNEAHERMQKAGFEHRFINWHDTGACPTCGRNRPDHTFAEWRVCDKEPHEGFRGMP